MIKNNDEKIYEKLDDLVIKIETRGKPSEPLQENPLLIASFENEDLRQLQNKIDEPKQIEVDEDGKKRALTFIDKKPKYKLAIENIEELEDLISKTTYNNTMTRQSTSKLLWILISQLTKVIDIDAPLENQYFTSNPTLEIPLRKLAELEGKSTTKDGLKDLRARTKIDLRILNSILFTKQKGKSGDFADVGLGANNLGIERGVAYFEMRKEFANRVILEPRPYLAYIPDEIFKSNEKYNPYSFNLGLAIFIHKRRNLGKRNENIISVRNLYENCKLIPRYEDVINSSDRHVDKRIMQAFERDLDALSDVFSWEYNTPKKNPNTNKDYANFDEWLKLNIKITWLKDLGTQTITQGRADAKKVIEKAKEKELKKIGKGRAKQDNK